MTKIYSLLDRKERLLLVWLIFAVVVVGLIEVAGVASIMPFMAVVANPEVIEENRYLFFAYQYLNFSSTHNFLIFLGFVVFLILLLSNGLRALVLWGELNFVHFRLYNFSRRLFFCYLCKPYIFFLNQNTSELSKNILQEVSKFSHDFLRPCIQIFIRSVVVVFIFVLLVFVDHVLALVILSVLGGAYSSIYLLNRRRQTRLGVERFEANYQRCKITDEAFGGIKDLKILNRERFFFNRFSSYAFKIEKSMVNGGLIAALPTYIMEVLAFGVILLIVLYSLMIRQDLDQILPVIALYAFAGSRLMPALQGIFSALNVVRYNRVVLDAIHRHLSESLDVSIDWQPEERLQLPFRDTIKFAAITFTYPGAATPTIRELNLTIKKNTSVGFVGATGAGKTTAVDILLGLLNPQKGYITVDDVPVTTERVLNWQKNLGYVPQSIFLCDDTLASNIAFGVSPADIDMLSVERASRIANLHDFVVNELPEGYLTEVGERGVRLSGGQIQRIGIARALYYDPNVLVMDEATSALDGITEEAVIQAIHNLSGKKTLVIIAHRLTTLMDCDLIYVMEEGRLVEQGSYEELYGLSSRFRAMSKVK